MSQFEQLGYFLEYMIDDKYIGSIIINKPDRKEIGYYGRIDDDAKNDYEFKKENDGIKKLKEIIFSNNETLKKIKAEEKALNLLKSSRDKDYHIFKNYALGKRESKLLNKIKDLKEECLIDAKNFKINKTVRLIAAEYSYKLDLIIKSHNV